MYVVDITLKSLLNTKKMTMSNKNFFAAKFKIKNIRKVTVPVTVAPDSEKSLVGVHRADGLYISAAVSSENDDFRTSVLFKSLFH